MTPFAEHHERCRKCSAHQTDGWAFPGVCLDLTSIDGRPDPGAYQLALVNGRCPLGKFDEEGRDERRE
jgi:hypothetical protein